MPYVIRKTDGTTLTTIPDAGVDTTTTLKLVGKNYSGYGLDQNENFVQLLENFANTTSPPTPITGQLWYDKTSGVNKLKVYAGNAFKEVGSAVVSAAQPTNWNTGEFWLNSARGQLFVNIQGTPTLLGPLSNSAAGTNGQVYAQLSDNTPTAHNTVGEYVGNNLLAIWSQDTFVPVPALSNFPLGLTAGLNINSSAQLNVLSNSGIFVGNQQQANISILNTSPNVVLVTNNYNNGQLQFQTNNGTSTVTQLTIDGPTGHVGINTTTPAATLDVSGIINSNTGIQLSSGNLLVGGTNQPGTASSVVVIYNGAPPTVPVTGGVMLYAQNTVYPGPVSQATSELQVMDELGNITTLSPHNFSLIPEGPSEPLAWSYYSERNGNKINVDMLKMARLLEKLTGEKLVHTEAAK